MIRIRKIKGNSMLPFLRAGDYVLVIKRPLKIGDVVVARHPQFGEIIKRIARVNNSSYELAGDNAESVSMQQIGAVPAECIVGKVVMTI